MGDTQKKNRCPCGKSHGPNERLPAYDWMVRRMTEALAVPPDMITMAVPPDTIAMWPGGTELSALNPSQRVAWTPGGRVVSLAVSVPEWRSPQAWQERAWRERANLFVQQAPPPDPLRAWQERMMRLAPPLDPSWLD